ncbi:MAG TPA: acetylornithine deacetylase [Cellvibrionaceae bacterium]|nr:acetylornithine deacetylase [Cellvibrionaceae bacterium]
MASQSTQFIQRLAQLVKIPSVSSTDARWDMSNRAVVEILAQWLEPLGFNCQLHAIDNSPGKFNLIAQRGSGPGGLVLAGHTDTVPCNPERWAQDPFSLTERDGRLYGLGATDMKGFFPCILAALEQLPPADFKQPLIVLATADEESTMNGARALQQQGFPAARAAIIGEPTGLQPIRMHKGILLHAIEVIGQAGHSSNPNLGTSALEAMHSVTSELMTFRAELQAKYNHPSFSYPKPSLNLGCIHGGDNPNRICGRCELLFDLRPLPGMDSQAIKDALKQRLIPIAERTHTQIHLKELSPGIAPFEEAASSELIHNVEAWSGQGSAAVNFATEAPFLQQLGIQTVVCGPGFIDQAHQPDEYIPLPHIPLTVDFLLKAIGHYCL